jgi:hypothetical protein
MTMRTRSLALLVLILALGCSDSKHGTVSGTVTLDGQPLPNAIVSFQPSGTEVNPGPGSVGHTNDKGEYTLEVVGGGHGAVVGWHKVTIRAGGDATGGASKVAIPGKYNTKSELKYEVKPGHNPANFELSSK